MFAAFMGGNVEHGPVGVSRLSSIPQKRQRAMVWYRGERVRNPLPQTFPTFPVDLFQSSALPY